MRPPRRDDTIAIPAAPIRRLVAILVPLTVVALVLLALWSQRERVFPTDDRRVDHSTYQALFLTSSQVYFGRLTIDGQTYLLRDVFYLNAPQGSSGAGQLVKRGNELHGPTEPMVVPAESVLFFENMRTDSEVMAAIRAFKSGATPPPTAAPTQTPVRTASPSPTR